MKNKELRLFGGLISLLWAITGSYIIFDHGIESPSMFILPILATLFSAHFALKGPTKKSSIFGKIMLFGGILALLTLMADKGLIFDSLDAIIRSLAVVTGIFFERFSPHKKLKNFMFLAIATKIQFILVTVLINIARNLNITSSYLPVYYWYSLVVLMAVSVPALALEKINIYRILVWITTVFSILLAVSILIADPEYLLTIIVVFTVSWPIVMTRLIGRRVFFGEKTLQKAKQKVSTLL